MSEDSPEARAGREAADWVVRLSRPAVAYSDLTDFYAWKREPINARAYARAEALWSRSKALEADPAIGDAVRQALERPMRKRQLASATWATIGAIALAIVLFIWLGSATTQTFATEVGERRQIALEDGSAVLLDTASRITVDYGSMTRDVRLDRGRARFDVRHGDKRAFRVDVAGATLVATGTRFDVRDDGIASSVTLLSGGVRIEETGTRRSRPLASGETAIIAAGRVRDVRRTRPGDIGWASGNLVFDHTPLAQAVAEINRYGLRPIIIASPSLAHREISGVFDPKDSEGFVVAVCAMFNLADRRTASGKVELWEAGS